MGKKRSVSLFCGHCEEEFYLWQKKSITRKGIYDAQPAGHAPSCSSSASQHMFAMFGATVLVPLLTGLSVSTTLLCAGLGTLLFHFLHQAARSPRSWVPASRIWAALRMRLTQRR